MRATLTCVCFWVDIVCSSLARVFFWLGIMCVACRKRVIYVENTSAALAGALWGFWGKRVNGACGWARGGGICLVFERCLIDGGRSELWVDDVDVRVKKCGGSMRILVVDDDAHIRQVLRFSLEQAGYEVVEAENGAVGLERFGAVNPDLVILDVMMPEMDGTEVCRQIRRVSEVPILFLSSRDDEIDRVVGLELGADDYVAKPFSPRELVARVKAILRRVGGSSGGSGGEPVVAKTVVEKPVEKEAVGKRIVHGVLELDLDLYRAIWRGTKVVLTQREFELLRTLLGYPGKVYSRDALMNAAYDMGTIVSDRTIDSHIRRLRAKFEAVGGSPVETVHGVGYRLGNCR